MAVGAGKQRKLIRREEDAIQRNIVQMLQPRERFNANGFPPTYKIDVQYRGKLIGVAKQGHLVGNAVVPQWAAAHIRANYTPRRVELAEAA